MAGFRTDNALDCSAETYWEKVFLDDEYNRRLFFDELHFTEWRETERKEDGGKTKRVIKATPRVGDVPAALKAVIADGAGYEERGVLDSKQQRYEVQAIPNRLADKISIKVTMTTTPTPDGRCRLIVEGEIAARIFVIGSVLEQRLVADLRRSYDKSAAFTNRFVAEKSLK